MDSGYQHIGAGWPRHPQYVDRVKFHRYLTLILSEFRLDVLFFKVDNAIIHEELVVRSNAVAPAQTCSSGLKLFL